MDYIPTRFTLTRKTGMTEDAMRALAELAKELNEDPRELASEMLRTAILERYDLLCTYREQEAANG